jgi:hypothetical protein
MVFRHPQMELHGKPENRLTELMGYIAEWNTGSVTMVKLMTAIGEWKNGC